MRVGAYALNFAFYLPENRESVRLEPVPAGDRALIDSVLGADAPTGRETAEVTNVTRAEIDAVWPESGLTRHAGRLELLDGSDRLTAGEQRTFDVRVWNDSDATWPWGWDCVPEVRLGSRWYDASGLEVPGLQLRTAFPAPLPPGASDVVPVHVLAPHRPGRYRLEIDLIHERVRWFGVGVDCDVLLRSRRRVAVLGGDEAAADVARLLETAARARARATPAPCDRPDGYAEAPCIRRYLFGDVPASRGAFIATVGARTLRLAGGVVRARMGRPGSLPRGAGDFLTALRDCELLVLAELDAPPERREFWRVARDGARRGRARRAGRDTPRAYDLGRSPRHLGQRPPDAPVRRSVRAPAAARESSMTLATAAEPFRDRRVLVVGGLGFIGAAIAKALVDAGADVLIVDALIAGCGGNYANIAGFADRVSVVEADIRNWCGAPRAHRRPRRSSSISRDR